MIKYHLITYGCQMNRSDSERIDSLMRSSGFKPAPQDRADILILNLCSVRQSAIDRAWGMINNVKCQMSNVKYLVLTGCILEADKKKFQDKVDLILDINDLSSWPDLINKHIITSCELRVTSYNKYKDYFSITPNYSSLFTAYVPIMSGCNNFCAYCAVPYTRGREYSRPVEDIIQEVYTLIIQGYKLIILLGQNVNSYQGQIKDYLKIKNLDKNLKLKIKNYNHINFTMLLKIIDTAPGDYWLSFITSHPKDMSDKLIKCFAECRHLIPYLHLPMQSGSDKILKAMNRKYTAVDYLQLIRKIRGVNRDISISTDVIVGFPGETQRDFQATADLMKKIKFDMVYLAEYSPRPGSAAARLKDNVSHKEKTGRRQILNAILKITALKNNQKLVGKKTEVLVESSQSNKSKSEILYFGKTNQFKHLKIKSTKKNLIGQFVKIKITKAGPWGLAGKLIF